MFLSFDQFISAKACEKVVFIKKEYHKKYLKQIIWNLELIKKHKFVFVGKLNYIILIYSLIFLFIVGLLLNLTTNS